MDGVVRYDNKFFDKHLDLNVMVGASQEMSRDRKINASRKDPINGNVDVIDGATSDPNTSGNQNEMDHAFLLRPHQLGLGQQISVGDEYTRRRFFTFLER